MFHLDYTRQEGFLTHPELGCLARALGFAGDLFERHIPAHFREENGIRTKELSNIIENYKYLNYPLHHFYNIHTDEWNLNTIRHAVPLIENRHITFSDLNRIRIAYQFYEKQDTKGLEINKDTLLKTLKLCDRIISPLKLMHRAKHMKEMLEEEDRFQLFEFFKILKWCEFSNKFSTKSIKVNRLKNEHQLYEIMDFISILTPEDTKLHVLLDKQYLDEEWNFSRLVHKTTKYLPKDVPPAKTDFRMKTMANDKNKYADLKQNIIDAETKLKNSRWGKLNENSETYKKHNIKKENPKKKTLNSKDLLGTSIKEMTAPFIKLHKNTCEKTPVKKMEFYLEKQENLNIVTEEDLIKTENNIISLRFDMETMKSKYNQLRSKEETLLKSKIK